MYQPYRFNNSKFELTLLNQAGEVLEQKTIDNESRLQHGFGVGGLLGETTSVALTLFNVPLKNNSTIKAKIDVKNLEDKFKDKKVNLYFKRYTDVCDIQRSKMVQNEHKFPINKQESNTTLLPLFKALTTKDTNSVKDILENNSSLCDSTFIGDRTIFHYSAFLDDLDTLQYLINKCDTKRLHEQDILQRTPLVYAIEHNSTKVLDILFQNGGQCPTKLTDEYIKTIKEGVTYEIDKNDSIEYFVVDYNLPEVAEVLAKNKCINPDIEFRTIIGSWETWIQWMQIRINSKEHMKRDHNPRWRDEKDYSQLLKVFKKYSKESNTTKRITNE